jgi:hypothetical protein
MIWIVTDMVTALTFGMPAEVTPPPIWCRARVFWIATSPDPNLSAWNGAPRNFVRSRLTKFFAWRGAKATNQRTFTTSKPRHSRTCSPKFVKSHLFLTGTVPMSAHRCATELETPRTLSRPALCFWTTTSYLLAKLIDSETPLRLWESVVRFGQPEAAHRPNRTDE